MRYGKGNNVAIIGFIEECQRKNPNINGGEVRMTEKRQVFYLS